MSNFVKSYKYGNKNSVKSILKNNIVVFRNIFNQLKDIPPTERNHVWYAFDDLLNYYSDDANFIKLCPRYFDVTDDFKRVEELFDYVSIGEYHEPLMHHNSILHYIDRDETTPFTVYSRYMSLQASYDIKMKVLEDTIKFIDDGYDIATNFLECGNTILWGLNVDYESPKYNKIYVSSFEDGLYRDVHNPIAERILSYLFENFGNDLYEKLVDPNMTDKVVSNLNRIFAWQKVTKHILDFMVSRGHDPVEYYCNVYTLNWTNQVVKIYSDKANLELYNSYPEVYFLMLGSNPEFVYIDDEKIIDEALEYINTCKRETFPYDGDAYSQVRFECNNLSIFDGVDLNYGCNYKFKIALKSNDEYFKYFNEYINTTFMIYSDAYFMDINVLDVHTFYDVANKSFAEYIDQKLHSIDNEYYRELYGLISLEHSHVKNAIINGEDSYINDLVHLINDIMDGYNVSSSYTPTSITPLLILLWLISKKKVTYDNDMKQLISIIETIDNAVYSNPFMMRTMQAIDYRPTWINVEIEKLFSDNECLKKVSNSIDKFNKEKYNIKSWKGYHENITSVIPELSPLFERLIKREKLLQK